MSFHNRVTLGQPKVNPSQKLSWVTWWKIKGDQKSNNLVTSNLMVVKTTFSCQSLQQLKKKLSRDQNIMSNDWKFWVVGLMVEIEPLLIRWFKFFCNDQFFWVVTKKNLIACLATKNWLLNFFGAVIRNDQNVFR